MRRAGRGGCRGAALASLCAYTIKEIVESGEQRTDDRPELALPLPSRRLRVRNHGAEEGAPVPPRVVSTFAALETRRMLIARVCRDNSVRAPVAEAIPTRMCGGKGNRVRGQSPAETRSRSQNDHDLTKHQKHSFCHASLP